MYSKNEDGSFSVTSRSKGQRQWTVSTDMRSCDCPKFRFILKSRGICHHMKEVIDGETAIQNAVGKSSTEGDYKQFDAGNYPTPLTIYDFVDVYGEDQYRRLTASAEIMLINRRVRVLK